MSIRYIDGPEARITDHDGLLVDVEFHQGETFTALEPRRLFPTTGLDKYITLLDDEGRQVAIVRDINNLLHESRVVLENSLREYYLIPKIERFVKLNDKHRHYWMWTAETDRGTYTIEIRDYNNTVKPLYDGRVLIKDANDNRYEIPNINLLDKRSQRMILPNL